jgi:hypothetical protein
MRKAPDLIDQIDALNLDLTAVQAILDCGKILMALERVPASSPEPGALTVGEGYASGRALRDTSLQDLLEHGVRLMEAVKATSQKIAAAALDAEMEKCRQ